MLYQLTLLLEYSADIGRSDHPEHSVVYRLPVLFITKGSLLDAELPASDAILLHFERNASVLGNLASLSQLIATIFQPLLFQIGVVCHNWFVLEHRH